MTEPLDRDKLEPSTPVLRISLLGEFRLRYGDTTVTGLDTPSYQALLAYLILHADQVHSRRHLAFLFWPDSTESQARTNLRKAIYQLRHTLPEAERFLRLKKQTAQWQPAALYVLDVAAFESAISQAQQAASPATKQTCLEQAIALYQGDFLPGHYDDWILAVREQLQQEYLACLEQLIQQLESERQYPAAITYAQRLLRHDPLHETTYRRLMRLQALSGNSAAALRTYHTCVTALQRELGVLPSPATQETYERLLKLETPRVSHFSARAPLVAREQAWSTLQTAWRQATGEQPGLVLLSGEAGIGKTRLAEELLDWARRQGIATATLTCYSAEGRLPYAPVAEWLRSEALQKILAHLEDKWLVEVARLLPEVLARRPDLSPPGPLTEGWQRHHLFAALAQTVLSAGQPLLLFIDDLHWGDQDTLEWLHFLLRFDLRARFLLVGAARSEEITAGHPLIPWRQQLRHEGSLVEIELERLDAEATHTLATHVTGQALEPAQAAQLYADTEGNPLFIVETARAGLYAAPPTAAIPASASPAALPPKVYWGIETRLAQLSPLAHDLTGLAATIGRSFTFDLLAQASEEAAETLMRGLDELWQRRIVREQGADAYDFSHDKIRQVAYHSLSWPRRKLWHRRVAETLERCHQGQEQTIAGHLAYHYGQAGVSDKALTYHLQAGHYARAQYAHNAAIDHYQKALALLKKQGDYGQAARALMQLGLTYHSAFDFPQARQAYEEGFTLWQRVETEPVTNLPPAPYPLKVALREVVSLDPAKAGDSNSAAVINLLFCGLVEESPQREVMPEVAHSWEILAGGRTYLFHLRDDARWSDGTPVTAADFEYAWRRVLDPATGSPAANLLYDVKAAKAFHQGQISDPNQVGVCALDDVTLEVELEEPVGYFPHLMAQEFSYPVPQHAIAVYGDAWTTPDHIVTNGPFRLENWRPNESMTLTRNRIYHGRFTGNVDKIELFLPVTEPSVALEMYEAGALDAAVFFDLPAKIMNQARQKHPGEYISAPCLSTFYLGFDVSRSPFNDRRVRRAFALATDRVTLADIIMGGYDVPATGGFIPPGMPGHTANIALSYDPAQARQLLAEAGYPAGRGFPVVDWLFAEVVKPWAAYLEDQWRKNLGIEVAPEPLPFSALLDRLDKEPPPLFMLGWTANYADPDDFLRVCLEQPHFGWRNETYQRLVTEARRVTDQETRLNLYRQADRILVEEAALLPLTHDKMSWLVKPWISKFPVSPAKWWFPKDVIIKPH